MSILRRLTTSGVVATIAIAVVIAACSSAATVAPSTGGVVATAAVTPAAAATSPAAATASPTANPTLDDVSPTPSGPLGTPILVDPFTSAGIATTVDTDAHAVDPSTYRTTIPGDQYKTVYVVFALKPDTVGKVTMVMTLNDVEVLQQPLSIDYGTINSWGDFKVNFPASGIPLGLYKTVMTYEPTGAQVVQYFAVT